jgi:FKBP12-rapamycin complex-associated protein
MNTSIQSTIILLIEQIVVALGGEFKLYLPQLIPHMLRVFMHDNSQGRIVSIKVSSWDGPERFLVASESVDDN